MLLERSDEIFANRMLQVVYFILISLFLWTVSANWWNVYKTSAVLNKSASFDWNVKVSDVVEAEIDKFFEFFLSQVVFDTLN